MSAPARPAPAPPDCQLEELPVATDALGLTEELLRLALRLGSAVSRRADRLAARVGLPWRAAPPAPTSVPAAPPPDGFAEGSRVRVLPRARLEALLDAEGRTEGLTFLAGMERFCGRELVVKRRVRMIFDERRGRMVRLRRTYVLEGAICDSRGLYDREGCDRCCHFFFKEAWLEPAP
jgi:hypothetical protein